MDTYTINKELDRLYIELESVTNMPSKEVCEKYNADSKSEVIASIQSEIESLENELHEINEEYEDDDMDYAGLQLSQGLAVTHW